MRSVWLILCISLLATAAGRAEPGASERPTSVAPCVARAEKDPAHFSPLLRDELQALTGPELIAGLSSSDPRPAVQQRILAAVHRELCEEGGHTAETAGTLLRLALASKDLDLRTCWLRLLGEDREGQAVLQQLVEGHAQASLPTDVLLAYVSPSALSSWVQSPASASREESTVTQVVELLWTRYVGLRRSLQPEDPANTHLPGYVRSRPQYHDRILALVQADVTAGIAPLDSELSTVTENADHDIGPFRLLLGWAESPSPDVRRVTAGRLIPFLYFDVAPPNGPPLDDSEKVRVRRVLLAVAPDPAQPQRSGIASILIHLLDGIDAREARQIADIAELDLSGHRPHDMELLLRLTDEFEELRPRVIARLLGPDLDDAREVAKPAAAWPPHPERKWIAKAAGEWIRSLKDEDLQSEDVQERFLIIAQALRPRETYWRLDLPPSRRRTQVIRPGPPRTALDKEQAAAEADEIEDREAFGLPPPAPAEPAKEGRWNVPGQRDTTPLTPREKTVRWQKFAFARATAVRLLGKHRP